MPITIGQFNLELKLLPLTLYDDGSADVTVRKGYMVGQNFIVTSTQVFNVNSAAVSGILDQPGSGVLTRRDDLSLAIYQYLVANNMVEAGTIS